jgi:hypothetical protein
MSEMWTRTFWLAVGERALKTFCQTLAVTLGAGAFDVLNVPWQAALSMSAGAAVVSVLTSIASAGVTGGGPSLNNAERVQ